MRRIDMLFDKDTSRLVTETETFRRDIEVLINKDFVGRIMLRKFVKYARLLEMDDVKLTTEDNAKIIVKIFNIPYTPQSSYGKFRVRKALTLQARKWARLHWRMMREAEPYLVAEAI